MLWTIFIVLLILWLLGFSLHIGGALIHLLLVVAVVVLVIYALTRSTEQEDVAHPAPTDAGVMSALASVPRATFDAGHGRS